MLNMESELKKKVGIMKNKMIHYNIYNIATVSLQVFHIKERKTNRAIILEQKQL